MANKLPSLTLADLVNAGFVQTATCEADGPGGLHLDRDIPKEPGVYLFVVDDAVNDVGVAREGLARRVGHYARALRRATRLRAVHHGIKHRASRGHAAELYTLVVKPRWDTTWLPVDRLLGLESGLIEALNPGWNPFNLAGRTKRASPRQQEQV
jgi:hypothetical protein